MVEGRAPRRALRVERRASREEEASLAEEVEVEVRLNGKPAARLTGSPVALEELAVGHLALAGRVRAREDVLGMDARSSPEGARVLVRARARAARVPSPSLPPGPRLEPAQLHALVKALLEGAEMYREGGGVHTSALATPEGIVLLASDIGKVNTLDRLAGRALLQGASTRGFVLLTTGRLTGAMVAKGLAMGCPVLASHSGPTTAGLDLAERAGATLVGYVRGGSLRVYCGAGRVAA